MITNYTMAPDRMLHDIHAAEQAVKPWNSLDAAQDPAKKIHTCDPPEYMARCDNCPLPDCSGNEKCWYMLGLEKPIKKGRGKQEVITSGTRPPKGYDEERLKKAMVHAYTDREVAVNLGISLYMTKKWLAWRYR